MQKMRVYVQIIAIAVIISGLSTVSAIAADPTPACVAARAWVNAHRDSLPATVGEMAALPWGYGNYAFDALSPEAKSRLWKENLTMVLAQRPMSASQQELVREAMDIFSPELYRKHAKVPDGWQARVAAAFSKAEVKAIFETLGSPAANRSFLPTCGCNDDNDCTGGRTCNPESCNVSASGCGPGGTSQCEVGVCRF